VSAESTQVNQLFMIYIGGSAPGAHIELHDVRFVVAPVIEATFPALRQQWFGSQQGLHMDSYVALHHVDGYRILLTKEPVDNQGVSLYFVNFGGYFPGRLAEFHDFTVVVAKSAADAKQRARVHVSATGLAGAEQLHKDDLLEVDDCLKIDLLDGYAIKLEYDGVQQPLKPDWMGYHPLP